MSQGRAFPAGSRFLLGRQALLILDGCLWMLAGAAVVWLGLRAYGTLPRVGWVRPLLTFLLFQGLDGPFLAVTWKETRRIRGSAQPARRPIWQALAGKSWLVLAGSVGGSLWLWRSGWVPAEAAAVICTALGGALALAGVLFWVALVRARRRAARSGTTAWIRSRPLLRPRRRRGAPIPRVSPPPIPAAVCSQSRTARRSTASSGNTSR